MNAPLLHARPGTTSGMRLGGLCVTNSAYAGAGSPRTGSFLPPQPVPDPQIQIDLRDPEEIARAQDQADAYLWALLEHCWAVVDAEDAAWEEERRADRIARGEPADPPRKAGARNLYLVPDDDPYLAEDRALRQFETGIVDEDNDGREEHRALAIADDDDPEEEDDPERDQPAE